MVKPSSSNFRIITAIVSDVQIFQIFFIVPENLYVQIMINTTATTARMDMLKTLSSNLIVERTLSSDLLALGISVESSAPRK